MQQVQAGQVEYDSQIQCLTAELTVLQTTKDEVSRYFALSLWRKLIHVLSKFLAVYVLVVEIGDRSAAIDR